MRGEDRLSSVQGRPELPFRAFISTIYHTANALRLLVCSLWHARLHGLLPPVLSPSCLEKWGSARGRLSEVRQDWCVLGDKNGGHWRRMQPPQGRDEPKTKAGRDSAKVRLSKAAPVFSLRHQYRQFRLLNIVDIFRELQSRQSRGMYYAV